MCTKSQVEQELDRAVADPKIVRELREVVKEVDKYVPGTKTKGMMYDLVHVVLSMEERLRGMEDRVCSGNLGDELRRQERARGRR